MSMNTNHVGEACHAPMEFAMSAARGAAWRLASGLEPDLSNDSERSVPPMLLAASCLRGTTTALLHEALHANFMRLTLHELDVRFLAGARTDEPLQLTTTLADVSARGLHELAVFRSEVRATTRGVAATCEAGILCLSPRPRPEPFAPPAWCSADDPTDAELAIEQRETITVGPSEGRQFADALGDPNPLYRDVAAAHMAGLPDVIVPALFSVTRAHDALLRLCGGTATEVTRLAMRFGAPVLPGDTLEVGIVSLADERVRFTVRNQRGEAVLAYGLAELRR